MAYENVKIEKITGETLDECKEKLGEMYGRDWVYKGHKPKQISYGPFNLRKKYIVELSYSIEHNHAYGESANYAAKSQEEQDEKSRQALQALLQNTQNNQLSRQLEEMEKRLKETIDAKASGGEGKHETIKKIEEVLEENDFSKGYIKEISEKIHSNFTLEQLENYDLVEHKVVDWIGETIQIGKQKAFRPPHVQILVGPTGVGKTTTLVKMAVSYILSYKNDPVNNGRRPNVCLIVTDFMRVGAQQQLERYGELLKCPVYKAEKAQDLQSLYDDLKESMDAIYIDTSGCSPNDADHIAAIKKILSVSQIKPEIFLAVTASSKYKDLENIFQIYEQFGYSSVIITKCDESNQYGNVISVLSSKHKTVTYVTNGQDVLQNLKCANVVDFLIRLEDFNIDRPHIEEKFGGNE